MSIRGNYQDTRWVEAKAIGYDVPAFGLVRITGAELEDSGRTVLWVDRPSNDSDTPCAINSHKPIAAGDYGLVAVEGTTFVLYDSENTPENGATWGAKADSFYATKDQTGLVIFGAVDAAREIVLVNVVSQGGGGGNWLAYTDEVIPGRNGTTPGGPIWVQPLKIEDVNATPKVIIEYGAERQIYSWVKGDSSDPAEEDGGLLYIWCETDEFGTHWFTGEDCPPLG